MGEEQVETGRSRDQAPSARRRGFLSPWMIRALSFWTITLCILVSVVACVLAIWEFAERDVLWRTVATCVVIGAATAVFTAINTAFGSRD